MGHQFEMQCAQTCPPSSHQSRTTWERSKSFRWPMSRGYTGRLSLMRWGLSLNQVFQLLQAQSEQMWYWWHRTSAGDVSLWSLELSFLDHDLSVFRLSLRKTSRSNETLDTSCFLTLKMTRLENELTHKFSSTEVVLKTGANEEEVQGDPALASPFKPGSSIFYTDL